MSMRRLLLFMGLMIFASTAISQVHFQIKPIVIQGVKRLDSLRSRPVQIIAPNNYVKGLPFFCRQVFHQVVVLVLVFLHQQVFLRLVLFLLV